jgi:N-glycosylase/DNA lyase
MEKSTTALRVLHGILRVNKQELNLMSCLCGGMSFRWRLLKCNDNDDDEQQQKQQQQQSNDECEFIGVFNRHIIMRLRQQTNQIYYSAYVDAKVNVDDDDDDEAKKRRIEDQLADYFRLREPLNKLYAEWSKRDPVFAKRVQSMPHALAGIRVLRLDPVETLFSFICSSNNNIKRITQMVENMCKSMGECIGVVDGVKHFAFPSIDRLAEDDVEKTLKELQFGYRARYIQQAAVYLKSNNKTDKWFYELREQPYESVCQELVKIAGVGRKVLQSALLLSIKIFC